MTMQVQYYSYYFEDLSAHKKHHSACLLDKVFTTVHNKRSICKADVNSL